MGCHSTGTAVRRPAEHPLCTLLRHAAESATSAWFMQARQKLWERMSDPGRTQFAWPRPGHEAGDDIANTLKEAATPPADEKALDTFALLVMSVHHVDYLSLKPNERCEWRRSGDAWEKTQLNP